MRIAPKKVITFDIQHPPAVAFPISSPPMAQSTDAIEESGTGLDGSLVETKLQNLNAQRPGHRGTLYTDFHKRDDEHSDRVASGISAIANIRKIAFPNSKMTPNPTKRIGSRLPWLDGNQSRRTSVPRVPGAFDDTGSNIPNVSDTFAHQDTIESTGMGSNMTGNGLRNTTNISASRRSSQQSYQSSLSVQVDQSQHPGAPPSSERSANAEADSTAATRQPLPPVQPRISVATIARQLAASESTNPSEANGSSPSSSTAFGPSYTRPSIQRTEVKRQRPSHVRMHSDDSLVVNRRPSLGVQPVRPGKVRATPSDQPTPHRKASLAVQPIRSRNSQSWSEEMPLAPRRKLEPPAVPPRTSSSLSRKKDVRQSTDMTTQSLRDSIAALETLMQEAMQLAKNAAQRDRSEEIPGILADAKETLRRSSRVQTRNSLVLQQDLAILYESPSGSEASSNECTHDFSDSSESSNSVLVHGEAARNSAVFIQRSSSPPVSEQAEVLAPDVRTGTPRTIWDEGLPDQSVPIASDNTVSGAHNSVDWAYNVGSKKSKPNSVQRRAQKGKEAAARTRSSVAEPQNVHPPGREQVSLVSRSTPDREQPTGSRWLFGRLNLASGDGSIGEQHDIQHDIGHDGINSPDREPDDPPSPLEDAPDSTALPGRNEIANWGADKYDENDYVNADGLRGRHHLTLKEGERFSIHRNHKRQPIARNWSTPRKRFTASVACVNTALVGILIGIYAGEVPAIQYSLADQHHRVILGNVVLYIAMGISTFLFWPLPLLHGRKPYTLLALAVALPLQFPQAIMVQQQRAPNYAGFKVGLLLSRALQGFALGFAHINFKATLLDLFGASLQSNRPHGEVVVTTDVRRHGGGMGLWLGIWSWCYIGSLALGFLVGADVISGLNVSWGFYISVMLIAATLLLNVIAPETRRLPHRRTVQDVDLPNDTISRRVARGEIKMHVTGDGPKWWWEEVFAGIYLSLRMLTQSGFLLMAIYVAWIYAEIVLIIVLLGNLLSAQYRWRPEFVGLGVLSVAVGALLAVPTSKANIFSRSRVRGPRTDSMTFQPRLTWTSHLVRRALFMTALPIAGIGYTLASGGRTVAYMVPIVLAGLIGYVSNLAIAECNGIIMETFDTSDLQPGTNSRHRLQSLAPTTRRRRTTYSSYPRVSAGFYSSQALSFFFAAAATGVGGAVTRKVGAQKATAITAGILLGLTLLLTCALFRFRAVQIIPNELFGHYFGGQNQRKSTASAESDKSWRAVIIGTPSGKTRRMSWLELGGLSRWTEIRRLNRLLSRSSTQPLNPGWK